MDKIGDLLNRLATVNTNAKSLLVEKSKYKLAILRVLYEEGWIAGVTQLKSDLPKVQKIAKKGSLSNSVLLEKESKWMQVDLKRSYIDASNPKVSALINPTSVRISKPGRRIYCGARELENLMLKESTAANTIVVSTNKGVMSIKNAVTLNLGGELLFKISA
jgi:ribosomal protein S8